MASQRLAPLLQQSDFAHRRLADRMTGPVMDSGDGTDTEVGPMTDDEFFWEPVPGCWSVRRRADGPGPRASLLAGTGDWGRDAAPCPHPWPPPFTTIAWRLSHISEMLSLRADHTADSHALTRDDHAVSADVAAAVAAFDAGADAWRKALLSVDDAALDTVGYCTYPHGSDPKDLMEPGTGGASTGRARGGRDTQRGRHPYGFLKERDADEATNRCGHARQVFT